MIYTCDLIPIRTAICNGFISLSKTQRWLKLSLIFSGSKRDIPYFREDFDLLSKAKEVAKTGFLEANL